eukprot:m.92464 g.92464  ORF g.92464 m.92464 type:complete len:335 (+) comp36737_c0_seq8:893-1897(+)
MFTNAFIKEMTERNMKVCGLVTDGEFNTLRCRGSKRPTNVLQIRADVRTKVSKWGVEKMRNMLMPKRNMDNMETVTRNPAVSVEMLCSIRKALNEGILWIAAVRELRDMTVPVGYKRHTWSGKLLELAEDESEIDYLRSLLAQLEYSRIVREYDESGVPFRTYMYVPEFDGVTGDFFHDREDHNHILKRIASHVRDGRPPGLRLECLQEAMKSDATSLTFTALSGTRKQDVGDAERLLSASVAQFLEANGYEKEGRFFEVIHNWYLASDGGGLTQLERCRFNYQMLNLLLDDLMPWNKELYDFSTLEVNRYSITLLIRQRIGDTRFKKVKKTQL